MPQSALNRIEDRFDQLSGALQQAARWATHHPADVCFLSLREQARRANVVPPTMTRLAKALGYRTFRDYQDDFRNHVAWGSADFAARAKRMQQRARDTRSDADRLAQLQVADVESLAALNPPDRVRHAAALLLHAPSVAFLGFRSSHSVALHAHYLYSMLVGSAALLQDSYGTLLESIAALPKSAALVAVGLAPYSRQTVDAVEEAARRRVSVVAITDSDLSPLARASVARLLFEPASSSFFHSIVAAHALVERLMAEVATLGGRKVIARLREREALLRDAGAYVQWGNARSGDVR
jgi:DNA-binding MurR/RpiR family transcriptional regulator